MDHPARLRICHDRILRVHVAGLGPKPGTGVWCDLTASAWCYDCDLYTCSIHEHSTHVAHRLRSVEEEDEERASNG